MPQHDEQRRQQAVARYLAGDKVEDICQQMACSKSWLYKWKTALPGRRSLLGEGEGQKTQDAGGQNTRSHRTRRCPAAANLGPKRPKLWRRGHQAGTQTTRTRASALTQNDLSHSPAS